MYMYVCLSLWGACEVFMLSTLLSICTPGSSTVWSFLCAVSSKNGRDTVPVNDNGGNSQLSPGVPPKRPMSTRSKTERPGGCIYTRTCVCVSLGSLSVIYVIMYSWFKYCVVFSLSSFLE